MTVIDFSTLEIYKKLPLIQIILRGMNGISLRHFLWKNISENLVDSEIKAKKKKKAVFNYYTKPISFAKSPEINLP